MGGLVAALFRKIYGGKQEVLLDSEHLKGFVVGGYVVLVVMVIHLGLVKMKGIPDQSLRFRNPQCVRLKTGIMLEGLGDQGIQYRRYFLAMGHARKK